MNPQMIFIDFLTSQHSPLSDVSKMVCAQLFTLFVIYPKHEQRQKRIRSNSSPVSQGSKGGFKYTISQSPWQLLRSVHTARTEIAEEIMPSFSTALMNRAKRNREVADILEASSSVWHQSMLIRSWDFSRKVTCFSTRMTNSLCIAAGYLLCLCVRVGQSSNEGAELMMADVD